MGKYVRWITLGTLCAVAASPARAQQPPDCKSPRAATAPGGSARIGLVSGLLQVWANDDAVKQCRQLVESRLTAESLVVVRLAEAQAKLFSARARLVMQTVADSLGLSDSTRARFWSSAADVMEDVWTVNREAPTAMMRESLQPLASGYAARVAAFSRRSVSVFARSVDTLAYTTDALNALKEALNARLNQLSGENIDADEDLIMQRMQPVLDSAKAKRRSP